ncbi:hypothetical protein INS49_013451 [Diaporthe citri]|uniref:uncharacterized protein n=1 Tax=Diaporthe citri TaxID=83186 RepID=UPI001C7FBDB5|nr:uncharacterized protein INS49_013451 [Diaporthe citri]KAG6357574.1 hypothetical protein INS49_013451 [Diaporthe citri]
MLEGAGNENPPCWLRQRHGKDIQTNFLSTYLLATLLLPILQAKKPSPTEPGRLTIVSFNTAGITSFVECNANPLLAALKDISSKWK